ncbi:3-phosphoshikimate 1-carboxyvinyltransferase [Acidipropionibacterium timonense]|uniref:3-phosphoshikimate 1-carboxyvinyltransferase n=1 Tax=Acidipropionibacterium timonense TaxID=2161818 RepID=UPI001FDAB717|nr:3-phosphoshikimate 1-carboxyvinyltransferase [Acidipropionibacterium timonense]
MTTSWLAPRAHQRLAGRVVVPGSKSQTNRALLLAGLARGRCVLGGVLDSRDSRLMRAGLTQLGVSFEDLPDGRVAVTGPRRLHAAAEPIDCGLAGTVMRFLPAAAATAPGRTSFVGDEAASARPVGPVLDGLRQLGVEVTASSLPLTMTAPQTLSGRQVTIDASASSQFVSALLLSAARYPNGIDLRHVGPSIPSLPHIDMTCAMLAERGVEVAHPAEGRWVVEPGPIEPLDGVVEPDLTNASVFLAAAMVAGGTVEVPGWPESTTQPGVVFLAVARRMGAVVESSDGAVRVTGAQLRGIDVDLHAASELTPVVAALAALADGPSRIRGVGHIRGHETDRLAALEAELGSVGVEVSQTSDGLVIVGRGADGRAGAAGLRPGLLHSYADHRMAHAAAVLGLAVPGIELDDVACTSKTMPTFPQLWAALVEPGSGSPVVPDVPQGCA